MCISLCLPLLSRLAPSVYLSFSLICRCPSICLFVICRCPSLRLFYSISVFTTIWLSPCSVRGSLTGRQQFWYPQSVHSSGVCLFICPSILPVFACSLICLFILPVFVCSFVFSFFLFLSVQCTQWHFFVDFPRPACPPTLHSPSARDSFISVRMLSPPYVCLSFSVILLVAHDLGNMSNLFVQQDLSCNPTAFLTASFITGPCGFRYSRSHLPYIRSWYCVYASQCCSILQDRYFHRPTLPCRHAFLVDISKYPLRWHQCPYIDIFMKKPWNRML